MHNWLLEYKDLLEIYLGIISTIGTVLIPLLLTWIRFTINKIKVEEQQKRQKEQQKQLYLNAIKNDRSIIAVQFLECKSNV
ncbi:MAG: hypothetical protein ACRCTQ_04710 [Brevinemataceae bacterium]